MDSKTYISNAVKTESVPAQVVMHQVALHAVLELLVLSANVADMVKRKVFYGKDIDAKAFTNELNGVQGMAQYLTFLSDGADGLPPDDLNAPVVNAQEYGLPEHAKNINLSNINPRLLHAAIGSFTESGELIEAVKKQYETGTIDLVNFGEEIGDLEWYQAIGFDATGVTEESCREKNIAKLKARYPDKFDADRAINRDLATERAILETGSEEKAA